MADTADQDDELFKILCKSSTYEFLLITILGCKSAVLLKLYVQRLLINAFAPFCRDEHPSAFDGVPAFSCNFLPLKFHKIDVE